METLIGACLADPAEIQEWLARAKGGEEGAFESLMRAFYPRLFRIVFQMVPNREDTEEILQESFFRFYRSLGRLRGEEDPFPFLRVIAVRRTYSHLKARPPAHVSIEDLPEDLPILQVEGRELGVRELYAWAAGLPARQRLVFLLREVEGIPTGELASLLGLREPTVRRHASLALESFLKRFGA